MLKVIISLMLFIIISYIGFMYANIFKMRENQLKIILRSLMIMKNDITNGAVPIIELFSELKDKLEEPFNKMSDSINKKLQDRKTESVYEALKQVYPDFKDNIYLNESDMKIIKDLFSSLGDSSLEGQEALFTLVINEIKRNLDEAHEIGKKNIKLYRYLGVGVGAMVFIFFI